MTKEKLSENDLFARLPYQPKVIYLYDSKVYTLMSIGNNLNYSKEVELKGSDGYKIPDRVYLQQIKSLLYPIDEVFNIKNEDGISVMEMILNILDYDGYQGYYTTFERLPNNKISIFCWGSLSGELDLHTLLFTTNKPGNFNTRLDMFVDIQQLFYKYHIDYLGLIKEGLALDIRDYNNEKGK